MLKKANLKSKFLLIILLLSAGIAKTTIVRAEIYLAKSIMEINDSILTLLAQKPAERSVLLIPLEHFLARPINPEFFATGEKYQHILKQAEAKAVTSKKKYLHELILTEYKNQLVDPAISSFVKNMQAQNLPLLAYSNNISGKFNQIDYLEVWTWSYLLSQTIDLSKSSIGTHQFIFDQYHRKVDGSYPTYYRGLLSANNLGRSNSVQSVLATLFAIKLKFIPDVIYVIHHDANFIKSIIEQFKNLRRDVQVEGFVFKAPQPVNNDLPVTSLYKFWLELIHKLNKITR